MKKKVLSIFLVLTMAASAMAGCGGDKSGKEQSGTEAASDGSGSQAGAADGEPYEIVVELIGSGVSQPDVQMVEEAINEITVPAINCTVKFREITIADHATQLGLLGTDGDRLDIVFVGYTTSMQDLVSNGLLVGLGDYLEEYAPEMLEKAGVLMDACYVGDDYYCVPGNYYPAMEEAVVYDVAVFDEYNIEIPENPEATYEYENKLFDNIKNSGFEGYCFTAGDGFGLNIVGQRMDQMGASSSTPGVYGVLKDLENDTEIVNVYDTDEYLKECLARKEWRDNGTIVPDSLTNGMTAVAAAQAGQTCVTVASVNSTYVPNNKKITGRESGSVKIGDPYLTGSSIPEYGLGVTVTSEHPEKAVQLLNLIMTNADLANLMNYGIEGVHYEKVSDHIIDYPEGVDASNIGYGIQIVSFGDSSQIYQRAPFTEEWYETLDEYSAENAALSQAFGYTFDTSSVRTQVAAVSSVVGEYNPSLMCGMVDDVQGRVGEFREALKAAGIEEIIAENQRQFDEWRGAKQ